MNKLTPREIRALKAQAQHLEAVVRVGKSGLTPAVVAAIEQALRARALIKVRFDQERTERAELAEKVAGLSGAELIMQVGKVAVFYRPRPGTADQAEGTGQAGPVLES